MTFLKSFDTHISVSCRDSIVMSPFKPNRNVTFQEGIRCTRKGGALGRRLGDEQEGARLVEGVGAG